eukprot:TRINITY_DN781_c0_g1_i2.p1 TRINITY_DN781_c0_g1~~TRINITY_DN781_c0_g1_i2.p1  ORF type:complete len:535 (-),score=189.17 TRINITY_DN781_c0_g1_i2:40-1644(-)
MEVLSHNAYNPFPAQQGSTADEDLIFRMLQQSTDAFAFDFSQDSSPDSVFSSASSPISSPLSASPFTPPAPVEDTDNSNINKPLSASTLLFSDVFMATPLTAAPIAQPSLIYTAPQDVQQQQQVPLSLSTMLFDESPAATVSHTSYDIPVHQADSSLYDPSFLASLQQQYSQPHATQSWVGTQVSSSGTSYTTPKKRSRDVPSSSDEDDDMSSPTSPLSGVSSPISPASSSSSAFASFTPLNKEQILKLTSREIEEYVAALKEHRNLSPMEERELKKQRRLIKNREYASQSRSRKRNHQEAIEKKLETQTSEVTATRMENERLRAENEALKRQLAGITVTIKSNSSLSSLFSIGSSSSSSRTSRTGAATTASAFLLAFLCVFSLSSLMSPSATDMMWQPKEVTMVRPSIRNLLEADHEIQPGDVWAWVTDVAYDCSSYAYNFFSSYPSSHVVEMDSFASPSSAPTTMVATGAGDIISTQIYDDGNAASGVDQDACVPKTVPIANHALGQQQQQRHNHTAPPDTPESLETKDKQL